MYDAVIIGAGPGGYECALEISRLGGKAALIEKDKVGGTCTNVGCIPTKALISSIETIRHLRLAKRKGIDILEFNPNLQNIMSRKERIVNTIAKGIENKIKTSNIDFFHGEGHIISDNQVGVSNHVLETKNIVIATGSEPIKIFDGEKVMTSDELLRVDYVPEKLVIIGGGVIGVEFALIFSHLGTNVTMIEAQERLLSNFDKDISEGIVAELKKDGVTIIAGKQANYSDRVLTLDGNIIDYDVLLEAVGRKPVFPRQELINIGVNTENKKVPVNERMQTSKPNTYAIGDVANIYQLAHVASMQGRVAANNIMCQEGKCSIMDYDIVPNCVYSIPEIGTVGKNEQDCEPNQIIIKKSNFAANAKARCTESLSGFIKIIAQKESKKIIGVHILGNHATDLISIALTFIKDGKTIDDLRNLIFPHPSLSEIFTEAVSD